jgi:two-component system sensor histidine kinase HydH
MAAVGEFATSLSHDVRNALTSVRVDLQRAVKKPASDPVHAQLVSRALDNVTRLDSTVSGALRVARGAHQQIVRVDLREVLDRCVTTVSPAFAAVPAAIELREPGGPAIVNGDQPALEQLFTNLLFNSAQASEPGGSAAIAIARDDEHYVVSVIDNGVGMDADEVSRASRPFYSSKPFGTGVGLAIVRQIAAAHDGSIEITSAVGVGTTVRVRLPAAAVKPAAEVATL